MENYILVTGGTGYIGSHTVVRLINEGRKVIIFDNLCNSKYKVLDRIELICNKRPVFIEGDIRDRNALKLIFKKYAVDAVIHFAGLKAVGESEKEPLRYYDNNVVGSIVLIQEMENAGVHSLIFSSSATVYGDPGYSLLDENTPLLPRSVYGKTKKIVEDILREVKKAQPLWNVAILRYFNPVGAHPSGLIGEDPAGIPNNLMPYISQVAVGKREKLFIFGNDYPTNDGTGVRDYIHVEDLVSAHIAALNNLLENNQKLITVNIGTGRPYSVLEVICAFERVSGKTISYEVTDRRDGDIASCYTDPRLAKTELGWEAQYDINKMCEHAWHWQEKNPIGYV